MPILDEQGFPFGGPYIDFLDLQQRLEVVEGDWPKLDTYREHIFFRFSDRLGDTLCSATRTFLPFNPWELTQMNRPYDVLQLSSAFLFRAQILSATPTGYLRETFAALTPDTRPTDVAEADVLAFHSNLLETILFLSGRLNQIALSGRCLSIVGI